MEASEDVGVLRSRYRSTDNESGHAREQGEWAIACGRAVMHEGEARRMWRRRQRRRWRLRGSRKGGVASRSTNEGVSSAEGPPDSFPSTPWEHVRTKFEEGRRVPEDKGENTVPQRGGR
jgi:hypothetical protein